MSHISGDTEAVVQIRKVEPDEYVIDRPRWQDAFDKPLKGTLDLTDADTYKSMRNRVEDSDYVFICDYFDPCVDGEKLTTENSRILIDGEVYEVRLYDDVMRLHEHMEIYLKYLGGQ